MAEPVLIDSNIILDTATDGADWADWSARRLAEIAMDSVLVINPIIYAEVSVRFARIEELDSALPTALFTREPLPYEAGFLAGICFLEYRRRGGQRRSPLPDFYIGAHAAIAGYRLLTRDAGRFRKYFPGLDIIAPD